MFSHQRHARYGGFREELSKAPGQRTPAKAVESVREDQFVQLGPAEILPDSRSPTLGVCDHDPRV